MAATHVLILGAAGRDFHNFLTVYRDDPRVRVVGFTAQQIPHIADRRFPAALAGPGYPTGIPIFREEQLEELVRDLGVDLCVMSYSDVAHADVMHLASRVNAAGADFAMLAARRTMLHAVRPVVAVCASRTGAGKSQTSRAIVRHLRDAGLRVVVLRHPMPYGDLARQRIQRFATAADLERHRVTIEEREEYEPHLAMGAVVYAGVDYATIVRAAEAEADVLVWDGGNNDTSFLAADLYVTVVDAHRPGHETSYYPGETNLRLADVVIINKVDTAQAWAVRDVEDAVRRVNPAAAVIEAASPITVDAPELLRDRRVLAVDDGPTLTHGGMAQGAAAIAAERLGARLVDPRPYAVGELAEAFARFTHLGAVLPALGYGDREVKELEETIARAAADGVEAIAVGTPIDLARIVRLPVPHTRVRYELAPRSGPSLDEVLAPVLAAAGRTLTGAPA